MLKDTIVHFDTTVTAFVQQGPAWLQTLMLVITNAGQPLVMASIAVVVAVLAWQQTKMQITYSMGAALVAMGANGILKHYIHRTRPDTLYVSHMYFKTSSFPSGHTFAATVVLGLLGYLSAIYLPAPWNGIAPILLGLCILAIGVSRVYVGAHFPTDVLAGWVLGAIVVVLIIMWLKP